ncbi:Protease activity modulator HflK [Hyphomicrobium sp. GJ21]|jgi:membrane protease subunit HflK|uniref:FtsH protease activity modulator HflK n=1 Tax=Hyphomicrobium sp. GJ21 TaxID=113574 RepID=UPI000622BF8C|nr:FtsH protease activity modulator HflK [Hyphomicrobium sp. GJ21]CEJ87125.1 Protease activity modulator HflK [Hyphomicrobium sp. GJ21]
MPWSNQGGGKGSGGGGGGGGPWGQGPWGSGGGGGKEPPDLDEILRRGQDRMRRVMRGGGGGAGGNGSGGIGGGVPKTFIFLLGLLLLAGATFYGFFYRVNPDEQGIVLRFGEYNRWDTPGLHWRLPYPIEEVRLPKVTQQRTIEVGSARSTLGARDSGLMLTGDGSVVDVRFVVFWRISPDKSENGDTGVQQFLFNIAQPETTVREVAESAMREVVGQSALQPLLTGGRQKIQEEVQKLMQKTLDYYRAGIKIDQIQLKEVDPPEEVIGAFREVAAAAQERETLVKQAQTYADQVTPRARGDADRIVAAAEGYRDQTVAEATGQAARFLKVYDEYKKAPDVTRQRLFLEMQERVLEGTDKIIIDQKSGQGVVPYLPLDQLQKRETSEGSK